MLAFHQQCFGPVTRVCNLPRLCRSPLVSFVYERGWRQGFSWGGFPGEAREFDMAMDYLQGAYGEVTCTDCFSSV